MSGKEVKSRSDWTLHDENIENVEHVSLVPEAQRELGCSVGEHVFLEYPWAYVPRETVLRHANVAGSSLEPFREKIEAYGGDTFLIGYSSTQLTARDFVICLTENARSAVAKRNGDISRKIRSDVVKKIRKTGKFWRSLGSEAALNEGVMRNARELFEVEICFPTSLLGSKRELYERSTKDSSNSYVELVPCKSFDNVEKRCISKVTQTHFEPREIYVQTYPGYPKNAWTQYVYEDTLNLDVDNGQLAEQEGGAAEEKSEKASEGKREIDESKEESVVDNEQKPTEAGPLELFLVDRAQEMIDAVRYNTVINLYVDDVATLARREFEITQLRDEIIYVKQVSLIDLRFTAGKVISDASWHPSLVDHVAISYVNVPSYEATQCSSGVENVASKSEPTVLLWSLTDSLRPRLLLRCYQEVYCISFCPTNGDFVIGGCVLGQVVVWNIHGCVGNRDVEGVDGTDDKLDSCAQHTVPAVCASILSDRDHSHGLSIRGIQWIPNNYRIEPSGKLTKLSSSSSSQFMTIAEDGTIAIWDLLRYSITSQLKSNDFKNLDDTLGPIYRLMVRPSQDFSAFTPLCLCLPAISVLEEDSRNHWRDRSELDSMDTDYMKKLWIGTVQGDLVCCVWEGQMFDVETSGLEECKLYNRISAHDGPVTAILRSPHLEDILLTTGGRVFAIWKDDCLDLPLFRRKSDCVYTACCWCNRPGCFLMGTDLGDLEIWDIKECASEPVLVQAISRKPITLLTLQGSCDRGFKLLGIGDCNSVFHIFKESVVSEDNIVERLDWFEEYVWREVRRKKMFFSWQRDFLQNDADAIARRQEREAREHKIKLETARLQFQREQEERLRLEIEEKMRKEPKSKDAIWRSREETRMKKVLLEKKRFKPRELEEKRLPLVSLAEERSLKILKARNETALRDKYFDSFVSVDFPEYYCLERESKKILEQKLEKRDEITDVYLQEFYEIRSEALSMIADKSRVPEFDWNTCVKKGKERLRRMKTS